jgi:hypothetical protein
MGSTQNATQTPYQARNRPADGAFLGHEICRQEQPMSRLNTIFLALGGFIAAATPLAVRAQSGDALAKSERTCLDSGIGPGSVAFDTCVSRAASAYDRAEPGLAVAEAQRLAAAREACMSYDIDPMTLGYRQCLAGESRRASRHAINYVPDTSR